MATGQTPAGNGQQVALNVEPIRIRLKIEKDKYYLATAPVVISVQLVWIRISRQAFQTAEPKNRQQYQPIALVITLSGSYVIQSLLV